MDQNSCAWLSVSGGGCLRSRDSWLDQNSCAWLSVSRGSCLRSHSGDGSCWLSRRRINSGSIGLLSGGCNHNRCGVRWFGSRHCRHWCVGCVCVHSCSWLDGGGGCYWLDSYHRFGYRCSLYSCYALSIVGDQNSRGERRRVRLSNWHNGLWWNIGGIVINWGGDCSGFATPK